MKAKKQKVTGRKQEGKITIKSLALLFDKIII